MPTPSSPEAVGWLLLVLFTVLGGIAALFSILANAKKLRAPADTPVKVKDQPLEVRAATDYATKFELGQVESRLSGEINQLHGRISGLRSDFSDRSDRLEKAIADELRAHRKETKEDIAGVHERVNDILAAVSELKGRSAL